MGLNATRPRVLRVDDTGIVLWGFGDRVVDVLFDGRRVWSFWLVRDTERDLPGRRTTSWPGQLRRFLDGRTVVTLREHVGERVLFEEEVAFGSSDERVAVVSRTGAPMGLDKSGRISATFEDRKPEEVEPLLEDIETVLGALTKAGVEPFLAYGTLLGAIREGRLLGHDSDADLAYVSRHSHPADVALESFRLQRRLRELGFHCYRYSGAAFRVDVVEGDGMVRGLDVFAGFIDDGILYLMGEVGAAFEMDWIYPTSTCRLEGRTFPVPARPEKLLEATYGPSWRVPDPAFKFETPREVEQRLSGWFRGTAYGRLEWERRYGRKHHRMPKKGPSELAVEAFEFVGQGGRVLDVGAGYATDSLWLARQGAMVLAYDFVPKTMLKAMTIAQEEGHHLQARKFNLTELRQVLSEGARVARLPGRKAMLARHIADTTGVAGRQSLARFASMTLRGGGRMYVEVWTGKGTAPRLLHKVDLDELAGLLEEYGARIVSMTETLPGDGPGQERYSMGRLVAEWE